MVLTKEEKQKFAELKRIARGSKISVTRTGPANVRFRGCGYNTVRQIGSTTATVSPEEQLRAMVKLSKMKCKR